MKEIGMKDKCIKKGSKMSTGNAGEYFVAGELERHGFTVALPVSNVEDFDILAINRETSLQYAIQVKTTSKKNKKWALTKKCKKLAKDNVIFFFVSLNGMEQPEYHIVPGKMLVEIVEKTYQEWLNAPGKKGQKHNETDIRTFTDYENIFLNRWDFLNI